MTGSAFGRRRWLAWAGLGLLAAATTAQAGRFWPRQDTTTPSPDAAAARDVRDGVTPSEAGQVVLQVRHRGSHYEVAASNPTPGPVQVRLELSATGMRPVPALPVETVIAPGQATVLTRVYPADRRLPEALDVRLRQVPGDPRARPRDVLYAVPFDLARIRVGQGFGGRFSHHDAENFYAVDFAVPEGTPVLAARAGTVVEAAADFQGAGLDRDRDDRRANFVRILHEDGSMALYGHLQPQGLAVRVGQQVGQGQRIALSGNTGFSTAPHLHFVVQANRGMRLEALPFRMAGAMGELKFPREDAPAAP